MHVCMHACIYAVRGKHVVTLCVPCQTKREGNVWLVVLVKEGMKKDCWHNVASHWDWARCDDFLGSRPVQLQVTV